MKKTATKIVAFLLILCMLPIGLFACNSSSGFEPMGGTEADSKKETSSESSTESQIETPKESSEEEQTKDQSDKATEGATQTPTLKPLPNTPSESQTKPSIDTQPNDKESQKQPDIETQKNPSENQTQPSIETQKQTEPDEFDTQSPSENQTPLDSETLPPIITETEAPTETQTAAPTETETQTEEPTQAPTEKPTEKPTETEKPTDPPTEKPTETEPVDYQKTGLTIFENGKFTVNIIRSDSASNDDKTLYEGIRVALNEHTGKRHILTTDFSMSSEGKPAVLIGSTKYPHSIDANLVLEKGQAASLFVNDKFVIVYTTQESMLKLLNFLTTKIKKCPADKVVIDSSWETLIEIPPIPDAIPLPSYNGQALNSPIDLGQGSELYIFSNTTYQKFSNYVMQLSSLNFRLYAYNEIAGNEFYTYITNTQIVTVIYLKQAQETRIIQDNRESIELTGTEEENVYSKTSTPSFTMMGISDAGYPGGMSFIFKLSDGTFFIIDGGMCANRTGSNECSGDPSVNRLFKTLQSLADDPNNIVISGWLITHIHNDHAGAFIDLAEKPEYLKKITIEKVIYSQPSNSDMSDKNQPKRLNWMPDALKKMGITKTVKAHPGQVLYFADLKLTILGTHDLVKPTAITSHNNASIVSMVEFGGKKMLFMADAEGDSNAKLKLHYGSALDADILQVAHHGYNNTNAGIVYPYVTPSIVLWPIKTGDWKSGANVFNVSFNQTYLNKGNIKHYCAGGANTTFGDLSTWVPTKTDWRP